MKKPSIKKKHVMIAAGSFVGLFIVYMLLDGLLLSPAGKLDAGANRLRGKIVTLEQENNRQAQYQASLRKLTGRMLVGDEGVSEELKSLVGDLFKEAKVSPPPGRAPVDGGAMKPIGQDKQYKEVRQVIRGRGKLTNVIDLLYLLDNQAFLHKIESVVLNRDQSSGDINLQAEYVALVASARQVPASHPATAESDPPVLDSESRQVYQVIASRDIFRPYIKKDPPQPTPTPAPTLGNPPPQNPRPQDPPRRDDWRLASTAVLDGQKADILFANASNRDDLRSYKIGDEVGGGRIIDVDTRLLPWPEGQQGTPADFTYSECRVIIKIDKDFFAVEWGECLSQRHKMRYEQLPDAIRAKIVMTTQPATQPK